MEVYPIITLIGHTLPQKTLIKRRLDQPPSAFGYFVDLDC